jgi:hypothetical protein
MKKPNMKLLSFASNGKTRKSDRVQDKYYTAILYLYPDKQLCPLAEKAGCMDSCLVTSGMAGVFKNINEARRRKTNLFRTDRLAFMTQLCKDIDTFIQFCLKEGRLPVIRLNGTSDIQWELYPIDEHENIFSKYPGVQFYDYTKLPHRPLTIDNYHLTFSYSGEIEYQSFINRALEREMNMAVVFDEIPDEYKGLKVIDGDKHDLRFLDKSGVIVGLKAKGKARHETNNFVVRLANGIS